MNVAYTLKDIYNDLEMILLNKTCPDTASWFQAVRNKSFFRRSLQDELQKC